MSLAQLRTNAKEQLVMKIMEAVTYPLLKIQLPQLEENHFPEGGHHVLTLRVCTVVVILFNGMCRMSLTNVKIKEFVKP